MSDLHDKTRDRVRGETWRLVPQLGTSQLRQLDYAITQTLAKLGADPSERIALHAERSVYREELDRRASS